MNETTPVSLTKDEIDRLLALVDNSDEIDSLAAELTEKLEKALEFFPH